MNTAEYRFGQDVFVVFHLVESPQTRPSGVLTVGFMVGNIGPGFAGIGAAQANSHHVALKSTAQSVERRHVSIDVNHMSITCQSHVNPVMIPNTNDKCNHVAWHARHLWPASSTWLAPKSMLWLWCSWDLRWAESQGQARFRNSTKLLSWILASSKPVMSRINFVYFETIRLGFCQMDGLVGDLLLGAAMADMPTLSSVLQCWNRSFLLSLQGPFSKISCTACRSNQGQVDDRLKIDRVDTLQLQNVHFAYPARPDIKVLQGVSLTIQKASQTHEISQS